MPSGPRTSISVSLGPREAFDTFVDELALALNDRGMQLHGSLGGKIVQGDLDVGTIEEWKTGEKISILWHPKTWETSTTNRLLITFTPNKSETSIVVEQDGWDRVLGDAGKELLGWFAGEIVTPLITASSPSRLGDWTTDRRARRPSGAMSRNVYRNPTHHWPNFLAILDVLALGPNDNLLEIGCGGGAFLHEALKSGCWASAVDHSPDMVKVASEQNQDSIAKGKLKIVTSEADSLPFPDRSFTCAIMTGVLGFLPDAPRAFKEVFRVVARGGRFVTFSGSKQLRGTPAAPEPMASRLHFYEANEIEEMARRAGFGEVKVESPMLYEYAKKAGLEGPDLEMFRGPGVGSQLLVARKS